MLLTAHPQRNSDFQIVFLKRSSFGQVLTSSPVELDLIQAFRDKKMNQNR